MHALLNRLLLWQKFALLGLFGVVLVAAPLVLFINESSKSVHAAEDKVRGIVPVRAVLKAMVLMQQHRGLSAMVLAGNEGAQAQRSGKQDEVEKAIQVADPVIRQVGNPAIVRQWEDAKTRWTQLPGKIAQKSLSGKESFAEHTALITQLLKTSELLGDHFGLLLDTEADSYHLADAALVHSPILMEALGRMRGRGSALLTAKEAPIEDRAQMMAMLDKASDYYNAMDSALEKAMATNPALKDKLAPALQATLATGKQTLQLTEEQIVKPEQLTFAGPDYFAKVTDAISMQQKFYDAAITELEMVLQERSSELNNTQYMLISLVLLVSLAAAAFGYAISRSVTVPLSEAVAMAKQVASGDLTAQVHVRHGGEVGELMRALRDMNSSLVNIVSEVRGGTETIVSASSQIAVGNMDLSSRTEQQASSLEETASSMEELTSTVKQNAGNARQANQLAQTASEVAVKGGAVVSHVVETMGSINESSKKIVDIISVIDGIAFQTNILALNAAVEAARAGEQGRGFAVVASEVRTLAQRSANAAKEIKELINDSVEKVDAGARLVDQTGATMDEIVASIKRVSDIIAEITAASNEQSAGIEQVNIAITQMDEVTQQNSSLVEEAAAAAASLQEQAQNLAQLVSVFQLGDTQSSRPQADIRTPLRTVHKAPVTRLATGASHTARLGKPAVERIKMTAS